MAKKTGKRKKLRLKKSVRRTIATLLMITAIIVAAIPAPTIKAATSDAYHVTQSDGSNVQFFFDYEDDGTATITGYDYWNEDGSDITTAKDQISKLEIPEYVENKNGDSYLVTVLQRIDATDGAGTTLSLTSVDLSNSKVESIANDCFSGDKGLKDISFPDTVTTLGNKAFKGCESLVTFDIPSSVENIGEGCFMQSGIGTIKIESDKITVLPQNVFCKSALTKVEFGENSSIKEIGPSAFSGCTSLSDIKLPSGLEVIGSAAFQGCVMSEIDIPESVRDIQSTAFNNCTNLTKVNGFENCKIESLNDSVFANCERLMKIKLPDSCKTAAAAAFYQCRGLTNVDLNQLTRIPTNLLSAASGLQELRLYNNDGRSSDYPTQDSDCVVEGNFLSKIATPEVYAFQYFKKGATCSCLSGICGKGRGWVR